MRRWLVAAVAVTLTLAGCGGQQIDTKQWQVELASLGYQPLDMQAYADDVHDVCAGSSDALDAYLAASAAAGDLDLDVERINFRHVCPDRLDDLDRAAQAVQDRTAGADEACTTPESAATEDRGALAEPDDC